MPIEIDTARDIRPMAGSGVRLTILGPLRLWRDDAEIDVGPRQQMYLLAILAARVGRPTSVTELVDLIWGEHAPPSALNVIHKYVGALRRLLQPALPPRNSGSYLLRKGNSYLFTASAHMLDLVDFREHVTAASAAAAEGRITAALDLYADALRLWTGPAADGLEPGPNAIPVFSGLTNEYLEACTAAAQLAESVQQPERMVAALQLAATMAPLHEPVQAALVTALGSAGRQAEALSVFRAVRGRLVEDLGLDPGQALLAAHQHVLGQPSTRGPAPKTGPALVGRAEECAVVKQSLDPVFSGGSALVVVEGAPGVGKTRLLERVAAESDQQGALVVWARCLQGDGTPSMWPWVHGMRIVVDALPAADQSRWLDSDLGRLVTPRDGLLAGSVLLDSGAQFRLFEKVVGAIGELAARRPLVLVIDDLHWADVASLQLFAHLSERLPAGAALTAALRDRAPAPGTELARTLAAASRVAVHRRIRLGPLALHDVAEIVRLETGHDPKSETARNIHARTAGNPFFVRELSRFLADSGALTAGGASLAGVPTTVRDVVRDRIVDLDSGSRDLLQASALIGREVGIGLLATILERDIPGCLDLLALLEGLGLVEPTSVDPHSFQFSHDLVRECVVGSTPPGRAIELHMRIADALERPGSDDESTAERLAYHLWSAGPLAEPRRTVDALVKAGIRAASKSALEAAERHLRTAVEISRRSGLAELELSSLSHLTAVVGMRSMYGTAALDLLERAEHLARGLGRDMEATAFLFSRWTAHHQAVEFTRSGPLARQLLDQGYASSDPMMRMYGLQAWGIHQSHIGNTGEAIRYLRQSERTLLTGLEQHEEDPVRGDLQLLMTGMLAEISALHGDVVEARRLLDLLETVAGDNPYRLTIWATMVSRVASLVGDVAWAIRGAQRGIAVDPGFSFVFLGTYQRLAHCWAMAVSGREPAAAAEQAQRIIATNLLDPPRSCVATWYGLLGEMHLAADSLRDAVAALDRADFYLNAYGQRYPEALLLLIRARVQLADGAPRNEVRKTAETAHRIADERETYLFADRAKRFLAELDNPIH
jgi:DNA-binding SARP family transcriptional activator